MACEEETIEEGWWADAGRVFVYRVCHGLEGLRYFR